MIGDLFGDDLRRFWHLTWTLAWTEWKLRFFGSVLGYTWTLARPLLFFSVIYFVFSEVADVGKAVENYPVYLLTAMVLFFFFTEATSGALGALVNRENLLRKVRFPRLVVPLAVVVGALLNLGSNLVVVLGFALANGIYPRWSWLQLPLLVVIMVVLATGCGLLLSALFVRYRDMQPIWDVSTQVLFYASPVLYVVTQVPDAFQRPMVANPIAAVLTQMRHAFVDGSAPTVWAAIGGAPRLLIPAGLVLGVFALGCWVFARQAPVVAEHL